MTNVVEAQRRPHMNYQKVKLNKLAMGRRIASVILQAHYSFEDVAKILGLSSVRTVYYWTKGTKLPSLENLVNIALMFNKKLEDLIILD